MDTSRLSRVTVVGSGYVGTVVAGCFARLGHEVVVIETNPAKLAQLQSGRVPFYEPGLEELVRSGLRAGRLRFTTDYGEGVADTAAVFLCVGTPRLPDGSADMSAVRLAAQSLANVVRHPVTVVIKSTIPIGGARFVSEILREALGRRDGSAAPVALVHNPEFLREGSAIVDFLYPDRVVLGGADAAALKLVTELYRPIIEQSFEGADTGKRPRLMITDVTTAEMVKYASNAFLATKISFINEIANICDLVGADVTDVATGMGLDHRISAAFLSAGLGWGGSCFGKDLSALIATAQHHGYRPLLLTATVQANARQREVVLGKLIGRLPDVTGRRVGLLGLSFKPGTDDLRDSPALDLAQRLIGLGVEVIAHDPVVSRVQWLPELVLVEDPYAVAEDADGVLLATEWPDFLLLDLAKLQSRMRGNVFVDGRNLFNQEMMQAVGLEYESVGCSATHTSGALWFEGPADGHVEGPHLTGTFPPVRQH